MKPLIIGEAPSKNEPLVRPIEGRVGRRLAALAGLSFDEFLAHFDRTNLLPDRQDTAEKGFQFDMAKAKIAAYYMLLLTTGQEPVVLLLGQRVARAFSLKPVYFVQQEVGRWQDVRVLPHPSGVNRWWNTPQHLLHAKEFMQTIVRRTR